MKKRIVFLILLCGCFLLSGCGKESAKSIVDKLDKKLEKMDAYQVTGDLNIYSNEDQYVYDVTVSYQKENQFRVLLKNKTNNHEQIILRNDEGVYVLTHKGITFFKDVEQSISI